MDRRRRRRGRLEGAVGDRLHRAHRLVLGAEGKGIRPLVLRGCDLLVKIPMFGKVASLNVGAAGAMLLYEVVRQRAAGEVR